MLHTQNPLPLATPFALLQRFYMQHFCVRHLYTHIRELTSMLQTTWAAKNPHINLYDNVPFPPLDIQKTSRGIFPYGPPPQKVCRHILFNSADASGLHPTPPHPQNSFLTHPNRPLLFPSPSPLLFPFSSFPSTNKSGPALTVQARFLSLLSLLCRYDNGFTDT